MKGFPVIFVLMGVALHPVASSNSFNRPRAYEDSEIRELCSPDEDMLQCVREYFREHAMCLVVREPRPEQPVTYSGPYNTYSTSINITYVLTDLKIYNMSGFFETFHLDKKSGEVVLTINLQSLNHDQNLLIIVYRRARHPIEIISRIENFIPVVMTATLPATRISAEAFRLAKTFTFMQNNDQVKLDFGSNFTDHKHPDVVAARRRLLEIEPMVRHEWMHSVGQYYFVTFIQKFVCDFGILPRSY